MTALTVAEAGHISSADQANAWLSMHYDELCSRARACFARRDPEARDEAVAEVLANVTSAAHSAARRGTLDRLTPFHCVAYAAKQYAGGRRLTGTSVRDVMAPATQRTHGVRVMSLDQDLDDEGAFCLREALADRDAEQPDEVVRRRLDYPLMLDQCSVSEKARSVFRFLAETHGAGKQDDLAAALMVSPGRITQLKSELAKRLAGFGYCGPLGPWPTMR